MSILNEVKRIFGVNGKSIEEALSNVPEGGAGGSGGTEVIEGTFNTETAAVTLTKTWNEIYALAESNKNIVIRTTIGANFIYFPVTGVVGDTERNIYSVYALGMVGQQVSQLSFSASSSDSYPVYGDSGDGDEDPLG